MDDKMQVSDINKAECTSGCGTGCCCSTPGISKRVKIIACLIVAIAAMIVLAHGIMQKAESESDLGQNLSELPSWSIPAASLNQVASPEDIVFLYLPAKDQGPDQNVKNEIESAAGKAQSQGISTAIFALDQRSEDYEQLTSQVPPPFVLVIAKGYNLSSVPANISEERGLGVVSGDISEENLLYAIVAASRPSSGCCPLPSTKSPSPKCC